MGSRLEAVRAVFDYKAASFHAQRKCIGILGVSLPVLLALGKMLIDVMVVVPGSPDFKLGIESSISDYYYTVMSGVFVGTLFAIGVFLFNYRGPDEGDNRDNLAGNIACIFALGVALFPTTPTPPADYPKIMSMIHFGSAAIFLLTLAYFSLFLFTRTDPNRKPTKRKLLRNKIYRVLGCTIIGAIALCAAVMRLPDHHWINQLAPVFWLESVAVWAFGWSWLIKGEAILKDNE